ncbi:MAG: phosphate acyltransferase, partial [Aliifodinibius sp.]|nr:phosphate acyltransferase [Fodinibius sp.]NIV11817.1 phosphate acyltransferase [Fodinibius sp.]NIY25448.1 phosphate acyltransferase [Fodinibius sp.]
RVGLLNIGEEETKGHDILIETNRTLRHTPNLHFIGNIEGRDILRGIADVIVTEGYIGNVTLKSLEGMAEMTMLTGKQIWRSNIRSKLALSILSPVIKKL